jgi:Lon protease-like protein
MTDLPLDLSRVALFPLPTVVLLPRAVLPLHIFEPRYREMTADALVGDRVVAMALLKLGWEKSYYGRPAIEPVVCVGHILSHEKLPDGNYNFLLQGNLRARIVEEFEGKPYRVARLEKVEEVPAMEIDLEQHRRQLAEIFVESPLGSRGTGRQFREIVRSVLPTTDIADLVAFTFIDDVQVKQSLLADGNVRERVARTIEALQRIAADTPVVAGMQGMNISAPFDPRVN